MHAARNSRFTDNHFRRPGLTSKQLAWLEQRNRAIRIFRETGDPTLAEEIGLFWNRSDERRAREAQKLRFSDDPFAPTELTKKQQGARPGDPRRGYVLATAGLQETAVPQESETSDSLLGAIGLVSARARVPAGVHEDRPALNRRLHRVGCCGSQDSVHRQRRSWRRVNQPWYIIPNPNF